MQERFLSIYRVGFAVQRIRYAPRDRPAVLRGLGLLAAGAIGHPLENSGEQRFDPRWREPVAEKRLRAGGGRALPSGEKPPVRFCQHGRVARAARAFRRDEERLEVAEAVEARKLAIEAIRQAAQFLAGVAARSDDPFCMCFERVYGLGPVVEIERERGQTSERAHLGHWQAASDAQGSYIPS